MKSITGKKILEYFNTCNIPDPVKKYILFHNERYALLINTLVFLNDKQRLTDDNSPKCILDVGSGPQTELIRKYVNKNVHTLDIVEKSICFSVNASENYSFTKESDHYIFDLNDTIEKEKWKSFGKFSIIVVSEVLEHLIVSPKCVLEFFFTLLNDGGFLIIQTPNAAGLKQRVKLLLGTNPYSMPPYRKSFQYPHMREYTFHELTKIGKEAGFRIESCSGKNYFLVYNNILFKFYNLFCNLFLPKTLRSGMTIVFQKPFRAAN